MKTRLHVALLTAALATGLFGASAYAQPSHHEFWAFLQRLIAHVTALDFNRYEWNEIKNKKGGKVKTPRVMDEEQFSEWENFVRALGVATN